MEALGIYTHGWLRVKFVSGICEPMCAVCMYLFVCVFSWTSGTQMGGEARPLWAWWWALLITREEVWGGDARVGLPPPEALDDTELASS